MQNPNHLAASIATALIGALLAIALSGCGEPATITKYEAPKDAPASPAVDSSGGTSAADDSPVADQATPIKGRMLAAMIPQGKRVWFFKLLGPDEGVAGQADTFNGFVKSIEFAGGQPKWELPDGWSEKPGSGMRFATVNAGQPSLNVSVISLPSPQDVLENVNRWQGQLNSDPFTKDRLAKESEEVKIGGEMATLVNLSGTMSPGGGGPPMMRGGGPFAGGRGAAPFAGGLPSNHPPIGGAGPAAPKPGNTVPAAAGAGTVPNPGFKFATPEGWSPGRSGGMRKLAFVTTGEQGDTELTVTTLGKAGAAMLPNVNRWRGQVGLAPVDEAGLADVTSEIKVSEAAATRIELKGEEQAMSVVMAERGNVVWFFKLMGDATAVAGENENFTKFVESIEFPAE